MSERFTAIWSISWPFGIFCWHLGDCIVCNLVYFPPFWYVATRKIWYPWVAVGLKTSKILLKVGTWHFVAWWTGPSDAASWQQLVWPKTQHNYFYNLCPGEFWTRAFCSSISGGDQRQGQSNFSSFLERFFSAITTWHRSAGWTKRRSVTRIERWPFLPSDQMWRKVLVEVGRVGPDPEGRGLGFLLNKTPSLQILKIGQSPKGLNFFVDLWNIYFYKCYVQIFQAHCKGPNFKSLKPVFINFNSPQKPEP
jgi:hypothetical protein